MNNHDTLLHRLHRSALRLTPIVLNDDIAHASISNGAIDLAESLKKHANALKSLAVNANRGRVDYQQVAASDAYAAARELTAALHVADLRALQSDAEKLAYWINIYNFLVIDAVIQLGVKNSVTEIRGFFDRVGYHIGGHFFSAHDIEQGILRANRGHPALPGPQFPAKSLRAGYAVSKLDFRIHFALNCGAESCPPIAFYDAESIDAQLDLAAQSFLNSSEVAVNMVSREASLSKIFQWFAIDFGAAPRVALGFGDKSPILRSIAPYIVNDTLRTFLENGAESVKVTFKAYNWNLNQL